MTLFIQNLRIEKHHEVQKLDCNPTSPLFHSVFQTQHVDSPLSLPGLLFTIQSFPARQVPTLFLPDIFSHGLEDVISDVSTLHYRGHISSSVYSLFHQSIRGLSWSPRNKPEIYPVREFSVLDSRADHF